MEGEGEVVVQQSREPRIVTGAEGRCFIESPRRPLMFVSVIVSHVANSYSSASDTLILEDVDLHETGLFQVFLRFLQFILPNLSAQE